MQVILTEAEWTRFQELLRGESQKVFAIIDLAKRVIDNTQFRESRRHGAGRTERYSRKTADLLKQNLEELKNYK